MIDRAPCRVSPLATITAPRAGRRTWDVVVVGAGPAGAMAARESARLGARTLLVERVRFPRPTGSKVCGCCLGAAALDVLDQTELGGLAPREGAVRLDRLELWTSGHRASITLPRAVALSRTTLDAALVRSAIAAGVEFLCPASAALDDVEPHTRHLALRTGDGHTDMTARVVIAADGLAGRLHAARARREAPTRPSRIGAGATVAETPGRPRSRYPDDAVSMACARGGYVGVVRLETGDLDVAAAFDAAFVRDEGGPGPAASTALASAGLPPIDGLEHARWRGTPHLTRRRDEAAAERLFVIGDAAGYVEPFTGEGIGWALASGRAVAPFAVAAARSPRRDPALEAAWTATLWSLLHGRQRTCRRVARLLRSPLLTSLAVRTAGVAPMLAAPLVRAIAAPFPRRTSGHVAPAAGSASSLAWRP